MKTKERALEALDASYQAAKSVIESIQAPAMFTSPDCEVIFSPRQERNSLSFTFELHWGEEEKV